MLTAVGTAECLRPYYRCDQCHRGHFPVDIELEVENTELSPGVGRMLAAIGHQAPFEHGQKQRELLAGLSVTTKAVNVRRKPSEKISKFVNRARCSAPCNWSCPSPWGQAFPFCRWRWMAQAFRW